MKMNGILSKRGRDACLVEGVVSVAHFLFQEKLLRRRQEIGRHLWSLRCI